MNTPITRMKKILALARRGVDGEKETAQAMLQKLLTKYSMTIADLENEAQPIERHEFKYTTEFERRLLLQIVASVLESRSFDVWYRRGRKARSFDLTALQYAEIDVRYTAYRKALAKELKKTTDRVYMAFVQANDLGVQRSDDDADESDMDLAELAAIMGLMQAMRPTPIHRQIQQCAEAA